MKLWPSSEFKTYFDNAFGTLSREFWYGPKRSQHPSYTLFIALHVVH